MVVFVGCSSATTIDSIYLEETKKLANILCKKHCTLLFGSSDEGMMGILYKTFKKNKCKIISVLPKNNYGMLKSLESDKQIEVANASEQLKYLVNTGDLTIIMPGSYGTLSELMTSIQNKKLGEHNKKIIIVNINGFYDNIINQFNKQYYDKFDLYPREKLYNVVNNITDIEKYIS